MCRQSRAILGRIHPEQHGEFPGTCTVVLPGPVQGSVRGTNGESTRNGSGYHSRNRVHLFSLFAEASTESMKSIPLSPSCTVGKSRASSGGSVPSRRCWIHVATLRYMFANASINPSGWPAGNRVLYLARPEHQGFPGRMYSMGLSSHFRMRLFGSV